MYKSAWGHPSARTHALDLLKSAGSCPSSVRLSVRSQAALIAANLVPVASSPCYDQPLADELIRLCNEDGSTVFPDKFRSHRWHPHAEGHRHFGERAYIELGVMVALSVLLLSITIYTKIKRA